MLPGIGRYQARILTQLAVALLLLTDGFTSPSAAESSAVPPITVLSIQEIIPKDSLKLATAATAIPGGFLIAGGHRIDQYNRHVLQQFYLRLSSAGDVIWEQTSDSKWPSPAPMAALLLTEGGYGLASRHGFLCALAGSTADKFRADRDRFPKLIRLLKMELQKWLRTLIYAQGKSRAGSLSAVVEATSHPPALMTSAFVCQIRYDASQEGDHDLPPLGNTANERPGWFEYWTTRTFLRLQPLDENAFYGFLSRRFKSKTNLSGGEVHEFIHRHGDTADVLLFTPSLHLTA